MRINPEYDEEFTKMMKRRISARRFGMYHPGKAFNMLVKLSKEKKH